MKIPACLSLLLLLISISVPAAQVEGLYETEVAVADQSEGNRPEAVRKALGRVLVKLTGDRYTQGRTALAPVLERAGEFVQQYRYEEIEEPAPDPDTASASRYKLWVRFDEATLKNTLRQLSIPVWGKERPATLLWLVTETESGRTIVGPESDSGYLAVVEERARARGIPLLMPLLDLEDTSRIRPTDIWGGFRQPVLEASRRYHADSVLTGSIRTVAPGIWEGQWTAYLGDQTISWVSRGDLPEMVLEEGMDNLADALAARFVQTTDEAALNNVMITVTDIMDATQYASAMEYLRSLNSVTDVQVESVEAGRVVFRLTAHGGDQAVDQAIALGRKLQPISGRDRNIYRLLP